MTDKKDKQNVKEIETKGQDELTAEVLDQVAGGAPFFCDRDTTTPPKEVP